MALNAIPPKLNVLEQYEERIARVPTFFKDGNQGALVTNTDALDWIRCETGYDVLPLIQADSTGPEMI